VTKTYGRGEAAVHALRGVDLDVNVGELLMLEGPSGSGKTTLISLLAGLMHRDSGECLVFGRDYERMPPREIVRFRGTTVGFVFQALNLIPSLTATENAAIPLLIARAGREAALALASARLEELGFDERMKMASPTQLSGGQQQRVAIARALVHDPRVIVCDEPTSALDSESGRLVMDLMRRVALSEDRALIVVTHDERVLDFADRIARMEDGRVKRIDTPGGT
jgi:putative ABC transport system ATP-binding protein